MERRVPACGPSRPEVYDVRRRTQPGFRNALAHELAGLRDWRVRGHPIPSSAQFRVRTWDLRVPAVKSASALFQAGRSTLWVGRRSVESYGLSMRGGFQCADNDAAVGFRVGECKARRRVLQNALAEVLDL